MPLNPVALLPIPDTVDPLDPVCPYTRPRDRLVRSHTIEAMPGLTAACCPGRSRFLSRGEESIHSYDFLRFKSM